MIRRLGLVVLLPTLFLWSCRGIGEEPNRFVLTPIADVDVFEATPDDVREGRGILSVGIGRGLDEGRLRSYLLFDLATLPRSTPIEVKEVSQARLRVFAQSPGLADEDDRFLVTVRTCATNSWTEDAVTWNSMPRCEGEENDEDSIVLAAAGLPQVFNWDLTDGINRALRSDIRFLTVSLEGFVIHNNSREIVAGERGGPDEHRVGFVRFWSREREEFGVSAVPNLTIEQDTRTTFLIEVVQLLIAVLGAISISWAAYEIGVKLIRGGQGERAA